MFHTLQGPTLMVQFFLVPFCVSTKVRKNLYCNNFAYISSPLCSVNAEENNFNSDETDFTQDENNFTSDGNDFTSENTYQQHSTVSWDNGLIKFYDRNLITETYYIHSANLVTFVL